MRLFELILVVATLLTGLIWLIDKVWFRKARRLHADAEEAKDPALVEYSRAFFPVLALLLGLRSFVAEPFRIPSGSMMPSLLIGDFILVNKYAYGLRLPITNTRILAIGEPQRGDVAVFHPPHHREEDWIKRIIGLPGDTIAYRGNTVFINGQPLQYRYDGVYNGSGSGIEASGSKLFGEALPGRPHPVLEGDDRPRPSQGEGEWKVPAGHYFVMGDNRDNSEDSRFWKTHFLPEANLRGKATMVLVHWDSNGSGESASRIGSQIP